MTHRITFITGALLFSLCLCGEAFAQPRYSITGSGTKNCKYWSEARQTGNLERQAPMLDWVLGWLVSYGHYSVHLQGKSFELPPQKEIAAMLDAECSKRPGIMLEVAAAALTEHLGGADIKYKWER